MAYNPSLEAIKKMRSKKMGMDDFFNEEEIQAGVEDLPEDKRETDLAPDLKGPKMEVEIEMEDDDDVPVEDMQEQMAMQKMGMDQGDAILPKGMYEPGDENKKGFMGKAARLMMQKMKR